MYKKNWQAYLMIIPLLLFFALFLVYPFCSNVVQSFFQKESILDKESMFVGLNNYIDLLNYDKEPAFWYSLRNTGILIILVMVFQVGIALVLALLVNAINSKIAEIFKINFFLPIVISATALGLLFSVFYAPNSSGTSLIMSIFNIDMNVLSQENTVAKYIALVAPVIWQYVGFYFVIFLTGLANIPHELDEAAIMDGCSGMQNVFNIKIPMLKNTISTVMVLAITGALKVFDLPFTISPTASPNMQMHFMGTYMNYLAFSTPYLGRAAAYAVFMVFAGVILSLISNAIFKKSEDLA